MVALFNPSLEIANNHEIEVPHGSISVKVYISYNGTFQLLKSANIICDEELNSTSKDRP